MKLTKKLKDLFSDLLLKIFDFLIPEEKNIKKLILIESSKLRGLLPRGISTTEDLIVLFDYQNNTVKNLVKYIKFRNNYILRQRISSYLYDEIVESVSDLFLFYGQKPILVPMPMSRQEKVKRGFNLCEEICSDIEKLKNNNLDISTNILKKIKETKRQTNLNKKERILNLKNSMEANRNLVKNKVFIVLDDVYTTLSTFNEAKRALKLAGAKKVIGLFIAH